jgi:hypothetical protein
VLTDASGRAANTVTVTATATILAKASTKSDSKKIDVQSPTTAVWTLLLSPAVTYLNSPPAPPAGFECNPSGSLPVQIQAHLADQFANPVVDQPVTFYRNTGSNPTAHDHYGAFCPGLITIFVANTDSNGDAFAQFSYSNADMTACLGFTSDFCRTWIKARTGSTTVSVNQVSVTVVP